MGIPLIIDNGLYTNLAARMARDTEVAYFSSWGNAFPTSREVAPATGIPNVERVNDPIRFMVDGNASQVIVPDLYLDDYEAVARQLELPVFGSNGGNRLETDRAFLHDFLAEHGLPVPEAIEVEGISALADYLKDKKDKYVKVSVFRGDMETAHWTDWDAMQPWLNRLKVRLGPTGETIRFIVQDPIESVCEVGIDTYCIDGAFLSPILGWEMKDSGYLGTTLGNPNQRDLFRAATTFLPFLKEASYCNFFCLEMRPMENRIYITDATCRVPSPPGSVMMAAASNFTDVILKGANPDYGDATHFCEIVLKSDEVRKDWLRVDFPDSLKDRYGFHNHCIIDGKTWIAPHDSEMVEFGSACGWGASLDDAAGMAKEAAEAVEADGLRFDSDVLSKAKAEMEKFDGMF